MYEASSTLNGPFVLPRTLNTAVRDALAQRDLRDITSGAISPDDGTMVFRTKTNTFALYLLKLNTQEGTFEPLITGADSGPNYAFSPDGQELVYDSGVAGGAVRIVNVVNGVSRILTSDGALPSWHETP